MLTARGWWVLTLGVLMTTLGFLISNAFPLAALGMTVLAWFCWEWIHFTRARFGVDRITITRRLRSGNRSVSMVWAGRSISVEVRVRVPSGHQLAMTIVEDLLPEGQPPSEGEFRTIARLTASEPVVLRYVLEGTDPGILRFEGVRVDVTDFQGFFHYHTVIRDPIEVPILPPLVNADGQQRTDKRQNLLLPPGQHRLRRPGSGSELLDLRDYRAGDPPKMIAWKASARRDRLITKEFETEVPVRCTMFLDTSAAVRLGPPGRNSLARLVSLSAAVAQSAAAQRDLVGLTLFDEQSVETVRPDRGSRHLISVMLRLAQAAKRRPAGFDTDLVELTRAGLRHADRVYPDLISTDVNTLPWKMYWKPLLDKRWGWAVLGLMMLPLLIPVLGLGGPIARLAGAITPVRGMLLPTFIMLCLTPTILGGLIWLLHGVSGFFQPAVRRIGRRKRLAAVVAQHRRLGPGGTALLCEDDDAFVRHTQEFLADHLAPYPVRLFDRMGRYQFRSPAKAEVLAQALTRAVGLSRDNELYLIMADLFELDHDSLEPVIKAVRVARARHHEVLIVCPWLPGIPAPPKEPRPPRNRLTPPRQLAEVTRDRLVEKYHRTYREVRAAFARYGVNVLRMGQADSIRLILERLDHLRGVPTRR